MSKTNSAKNKIITLTFLIFAFLVIRITFLLLSFYFINNHEELYNGTFAHDFINNPKLFFNYPALPLSYQYMPFAGGTLVVSLLATPFFFIFGSSIFSLKLLSLFISIITFIIFFLLLEKFFSLKAALIFGILSAISPPYPVIMSLILWGNHYESILLSALLIFLMFHYWTRNKKENYRYLIFSGLVAGFGIYFDYIFFITVVTVITFHFLYNRGTLNKKEMLLSPISILIGLIPWFFSIIFFKLDNLTIYQLLKANFSPDYLIKKFLNLVVLDIPNFFWIKEFHLFRINVFSNIYYLLFLISFFYFLFTGIRSYLKFRLLPKEFLFVVYIILFSIIFTLSKFTTSDTLLELNLNLHPFRIYRYRFLVPLYPFIIILISLFLAKLKKHIVFIPITAALLIISLASYSDYLSTKTIGECFIYKGYSYNILSEKLASNYSLKKCSEIISNLPKEYRLKLYKGLGFYFAQNEGGFILNKKISQFININYEDSFYEGVGGGLTERYKNFNESLKIIEKFDDKNKIHYLMEGIMEFSPLFNSFKDITEYLNSLASQQSDYLYKAMGKGAYILLGPDYINKARSETEGSSNIIIPFYNGVGEAIWEQIIDKRQTLLGKKDIPSIFHADYDTTLSKILNSNNVLNKIDKNILPYVREGLEKNINLNNLE